jgi:hypothetical protein
MNWHWLSLSIVRVGSKPEELTASICRLLFIQYRTSGSATLPAANLVAVQMPRRAFNYCASAVPWICRRPQAGSTIGYYGLYNCARMNVVSVFALLTGRYMVGALSFSTILKIGPIPPPVPLALPGLDARCAPGDRALVVDAQSNPAPA